MSESARDWSTSYSDLFYFYEFLAEENDWRFEWVDDDLALIVIEGNWRIYTISVALNHQDKVMHLACSFDLKPRKKREPKLHMLLNRINRRSPSGVFFLCSDYDKVVYRDQMQLYALERIEWRNLERLLTLAVSNCEKYFPAMQMVNYGENDMDLALKMAITEVLGTA